MAIHVVGWEHSQDLKVLVELGQQRVLENPSYDVDLMLKEWARTAVYQSGQSDVSIARRLGVQFSGETPSPKPGDYVGAVWVDLDEKVFLEVKPKAGLEAMDYLMMYVCCADHPTVSGRMQNCFYFWPDQPGISMRPE